jgi:hypothetical protein
MKIQAEQLEIKNYIREVTHCTVKNNRLCCFRMSVSPVIRELSLIFASVECILKLVLLTSSHSK